MANETNISTILREFQVQLCLFATQYCAAPNGKINCIIENCNHRKFLFLCQTYIKSMDKDFVAATIQAIGRCATNIGEVRDTCLNGLVQLLSNRDGTFEKLIFSIFICFNMVDIVVSGTLLTI